VLGATSLAIGLALQGTLSNLAAGVMLLLFRPFHIGDDVEVAGKAGKVKSLALFMTELVAADNTQILLPNGQVWGAAIINHSAYPGTGEVKVAFPVPAGAANTLADRILRELRNDSRIDDQAQPTVTVTKVLDVGNPAAPILELTVSAKAKPSEVGAVKQCVLDHASALLAAA